MDRSEAYRLLADVVNLTSRLAVADEVVACTDAKIERAQSHLDAAEAAMAKATDRRDDVESRLTEAQALAAGIPPELAADVAAELGSKRATRDRFLAALAADNGGDAEATRAVLEAAAAAGIVLAPAGAATGNGEGMGV